jgi:hypothetical protein
MSRRTHVRAIGRQLSDIEDEVGLRLIGVGKPFEEVLLILGLPPRSSILPRSLCEREIASLRECPRMSLGPRGNGARASTGSQSRRAPSLRVVLGPRRHSSLGYLSPLEFKSQHYDGHNHQPLTCPTETGELTRRLSKRRTRS